MNDGVIHFYEKMYENSDLAGVQLGFVVGRGFTVKWRHAQFCCGCELSDGVWGYVPQENFKIRCLRWTKIDFTA